MTINQLPGVEEQGGNLGLENPDNQVPNQEPVQVAGLGGKVLRGILKSVDIPKAPKVKPEPLVNEAPPPKAPDESGQVKMAEEEASQVEAADFSSFNVDETYQVNFDRIETTDDIKAVIADVGERNKVEITEARRGKITHEQLRGLADDLNLNQDVVQKVVERESGGILNAETLLGARQVLNQSAKRVRDLAKRVTQGEASDQEKLQFLRQVQFHREFQTQFMGARAEVGRALNMFRMPVGADEVSLSRMRELTDVVHGGNVDRMAEMFANAETTGQVSNMAKLSLKEKVANVTYEVFVNSILSGLKTHVVNTTGNALFQAMNLAETAVAARIGRFMSGEEHVLVGETQAHIYGMTSAFKDAMRVAWRGLRTGEGADVTKLETKYRKAISADTLELTGPVGRVVDLLGNIIRIPTERLLTSEDEFFKTFAQRGRMAQAAYRHAMEQRAANNLNDQETAQVLKDFLENPPEAAFAQVDEHTLYTTFQNPLGEKGRAAQKFVASVPGLRYLAPFMRTPINLFKAGLLERSPLAVFSRDFREDIAAGGARRDMALARVSMGSLTMGSVAIAVDSGAITGGGPSDFKARKVLESTGWKPYSIRVEDPISGEVTYQSYARAEPLAYIIGATADMVEIAQYTDYDNELADEDERIMRLGSAIIAGVANNTMSKTFLSGLADFTEALSDPKRYAKPWAERMAGALIPYSSFRRDLSRIQDPVMRDAWDFKEKLAVSGGIPGWSENSPPRLDMYGERMEYPKGDILGVLSPFPGQAQTDDPVKLGIAELMLESKKVPLTLPSKRVEGMKLTNQDYYNLVNSARKEIRLGKRTFKQSLGQLLNSPIYQAATPDTRVTLVKDVQQAYDNAAKAKLYKEDSDYRDRLNRYRAKKAKQKLGEEALPPRLQTLIE